MGSFRGDSLPFGGEGSSASSCLPFSTLLSTSPCSSKCYVPMDAFPVICYKQHPCLHHRTTEIIYIYIYIQGIFKLHSCLQFVKERFDCPKINSSIVLKLLVFSVFSVFSVIFLFVFFLVFPLRVLAYPPAFLPCRRPGLSRVFILDKAHSLQTTAFLLTVSII